MTEREPDMIPRKCHLCGDIFDVPAYLLLQDVCPECRAKIGKGWNPDE
jgi:hypothetical protein